MKRKGIILAGGSGSRLYPITKSVNKQLLPIYDKPMIYYPISVLMLSGIKEVILISNPESIDLYKRLFGDGSQLGMVIEYCIQEAPRGLAEAYLLAEEFLDEGPSTLILGDNFFYGSYLRTVLAEASSKTVGGSVFGYPVRNPSEFGIVEIGSEGEVVSIEEKPTNPKSNLAIPGLYFFDGKAPEYAKQVKPSARGELEITDIINAYYEAGQLFVNELGRGTAWLDTGNHDGLLEAANFVRAIQTRQGFQIACLEEIALGEGWIDQSTLAESIRSMGHSTYREYLEQLLAQ